MQAFTNAILAEDAVASTEADYIKDLRKTILSALDLPPESARILNASGLNQDVLKAHDIYLEDALTYPHANSILNAEDIDIIMPFVSNLWESYSQLTTSALLDNSATTNSDAIKQATTLYSISNFFFAQKAKLYPTPSNAPTYRNE